MLRDRRLGSLVRWVVLLVVAVLGAATGLLSQGPGRGPAAAAAPVADPASGPAEIEALRTRTSSTFERADGSKVTRVSAAPVHFRDNGEWVPIDTTLKAQSDGSVSTAATGYEVALPEALTDPVSVTKAEDGVSFALRGAAAGERSVDGATATFADALPGVDVQYTAGADSVKEELVLEGPDAERSFAFDLDPASGATPRLAADGGVDLVGADGEVGARIAPPVMADASGAVSTDLTYVLRETGDGWVLGLDADTTWLRSAERAWPVRVDPTVDFGVHENAQLRDPKTGTDSALGSTSALAVTGQGDTRRRALMRFNLSGIPRSAVVSDGHINLRSSAGSSSNAAVGVQVFQLTRGFTQAAARWNHSGTGAWTTPGGDVKAQALDTQTVDGSTENWQRFYVGNAVQEWVRDPSTNHGVQLRAQNEAVAGGVSWYSANGSENCPYMELEWEDALGAKPNWTMDEIALSDRSNLQVNVATGNVLYTGNDVNVTGVGGMDLAVDRIYNSRSSHYDAGQGWELGFNHNSRVMFSNNRQTAIVLTPDHASYRFTRVGNTWKSPGSINATLTDVSGGLRLLFHRSGETWFYGDASPGPQLRWRENKNGHRITYTSNGQGYSTKVTDTHGRDYTIARDTANRPTQISDANYNGGTRTWSYSYEDDKLGSYTDPAGRTSYYDYAPDTTDLTRITDARGNKVKLTYSYGFDPSGVWPRVTSIQRLTNDDWDNPVGPKWTYTYDLAATTTTVTVPNGNVAGATASQHQTTYHWDETTLEVKNVRNRLGQFDDTQRSQNGDVTKFTGQGSGPSGGTGGGTGTAAVTDITFDSNDNPTQVDGAGNAGNREQSKTTYYGTGDTFGGQTASPATGQYRPKLQTDEQGNGTLNEYDAAGNLTKESQSGMQIKADLAYTTAADAPVPKGLLKTATDSRGYVTTYGYNSAGDLTSVKPPLVSDATNGSHNAGNLTYTYEAGTNRRATQTDAAGNLLTYTYDRLDRVTRIANGNGQRVDYVYDNNGNLTSRIWTGGGGVNASYVYDKLNRRTSETIGGVTTTYTYDDNGNLKTMVDGGGTTTYGYDRIDRVASVTPPAGGTILADYDDTGAERKRTWTYPGGQKQRTQYSLSGKVLSVAALDNAATPNTIKKLEYAYTGATRPETALRRSERILTGSTQDRLTTYAYDQANRLCWATTKTVTGAACGTVPSGAGGTTWSYGWDNASNRTLTKTDTNGTVNRNDSYTHDQANRLTSSGFAHDKRGNLTTAAGTSLGTDAWNRQSSIGSINLGYGTPDNTELITDGTTTLRNTLLGMTTSTVSGASTHYIRSPDGEFLGERTSAGTRYAVLDALGSTRWLLSGNTISRGYDYTPDGEATPIGTGADTRIRFAGGDLTTAGRYHYGARYYQPGLARWTQRDPLNQPTDLIQTNAYSYASANPTNFVDPLGEITRQEAYQYGRKIGATVQIAVVFVLGVGGDSARPRGPARNPGGQGPQPGQVSRNNGPAGGRGGGGPQGRGGGPNGNGWGGPRSRF